MKPELTKIIDSEFVPPITRPEELYNTETKETAIALAKAGKQELQREVPTYTLPQPAESKDPRSLMRKIGDSIVCALLPKTKTAQILKRIEEDKLLADAKAKYQWLADSAPIVKQATKTFNESYTNIAGFLYTIRAGIERMEERIVSGQAAIEHNLEQITLLETACKSDDTKERFKSYFHEDQAAQQAIDILKRTIGECKKSAAQTNRDNEYAQKLIDYHERLLPACERSLKDIEQAIKLAQEQEMDLGLTLTTYNGITKNQASAIEAMQIIQATQTISDRLKGDMKQIDALLAEKVEILELTAPNPRSLPVADPESVRIRAELEE